MIADPPAPPTGKLISWESRQPERHAQALERQGPAPEKPRRKGSAGRAGKDALMPKVRELAGSGHCTGWANVLDTMEAHGLDTALLRIWATATDKSEIDRMCARIRADLPKRRR